MNGPLVSPTGTTMLCLWTLITTLFVEVLVVTEAANGGWNDAPNTQYHIQTDEGPERYFRYQTISGQFRKEKRLEDGTVVGTNGWVDPNGYLRLQDYIADNAGYRILKSKMVYVGKERSVQEAVTASKSVPATSGVLVQHAPVHTTLAPPTATPAYVRVTPNSIVTSSKAPIPNVSIYPNGIHSTTPRPYELSTIPPTQGLSTYLPPISSSFVPPIDVTESYLPPSPSPLPVDPYIPPVNVYRNPTPTPLTQLSSNAISNTPHANRYGQRYQPNVYRQSYQRPTTYPALIDRRENQYNQHNNYIGDGYTRQYPDYDGVSVTRNGFRYYLPRQYHEEENLPGDQRTGSFGYIDPFGIRRVIYYNTAPGTGFVHRKNNRYVGFNATPYDPRPY